MIATPIGNRRDITLRALDILKEVDVVACEDTRRTGKLLAAYEIKKRMIACHAHNEGASAQGIIKLLQERNFVAYLSDAGTPCISDPGNRLVNAVRAAGFPVIPIPGVSALTTLLSVCSFTGKTVTFEGFMSPKEAKRNRRIAELLEREEGFVLYESPYRIVKTLKALAEAEPNRRVIVGREMTKVHEEYIEETALVLYETFLQRASIKGEVILFVSPPEQKRHDNH